MPKLIQSFNFESFSLFSRKTKIGKYVSQAFYDKYLAPQMHIHNNSVLHYLYNIAVGLVIYSKARAFKAKAKNSRPRPENLKAKIKAKAKKFGLKAKAKD